MPDQTDAPEATLYVIEELSLDLACPPAPGDHPERTPVGPFRSRQDADDWASELAAEYGGGSWTIAPLRPAQPPQDDPARESDPLAAHPEPDPATAQTVAAMIHSETCDDPEVCEFFEKRHHGAEGTPCRIEEGYFLTGMEGMVLAVGRRLALHPDRPVEG